MSRERKAITVYNNRCLKCGTVEAIMVRIGALFFCQTCFDTEFDLSKLGNATCYPEIQDKAYKKWLKVYIGTCEDAEEI